LLRDFREFGEEEEDDNGGTEACDCEVGVLETTEGLFLTSSVESLGSDCRERKGKISFDARIAKSSKSRELRPTERTDEGSKTVGRLSNVEAEGGVLSISENGNVGVGHPGKIEEKRVVSLV
jgi:hypothetical protein